MLTQYLNTTWIYKSPDVLSLVKNTSYNMADEERTEYHEAQAIGGPRPDTSEKNHGVEAYGKDIAITIIGEEQRPIDPAAVARAVRKMDMCLVPAMTIGYVFVYYDKVNNLPHMVPSHHLLSLTQI